MDKQLELFTNDWGINSGFKNLADQLNELLPFQGKVQFSRSKNKQLEKLKQDQIKEFNKQNKQLQKLKQDQINNYNLKQKKQQEEFNKQNKQLHR